MMPTFLTAVITKSDARALKLGERAGAVALVVALTAVAAQISIPLPFTPVPFTFQPMVVLVGAMALGARLGMTSQLMYLALGIAGLPVFAASATLPPGVGRLFGPTGGYLMAYPFAAFLCGWLAERGWDRRYVTSLAAMLAGLAVIYAGGVAWRLALMRSFDLAVATSVLPFLVPDFVKAAAAASLLPAAWRVVGRSS